MYVPTREWIQKVLSEGVQIWQLFFDEGREDPNTTKRAIIGPPEKRHLNGVSLLCRCWPNIESWFGSFVMTNIPKKPFIFVIFQGGLWIRACNFKMLLWDFLDARACPSFRCSNIHVGDLWLKATYACKQRKRGWFVLFVFVALRPMSTAMVIAGRSVHLTTLFPGQAWASG